MKVKWQKISSKYMYEDQWVKVRLDEVVKPDGSSGTYTVAEIGESVSAIPVDTDGKIWLVKHYRYIFDEARWELVAGDIEKGESPEAAARREVAEELQLKAEQATAIGSFRPSNGSVDQVAYVFLLQGLTKIQPIVDEPEIWERKAFSLDEIEQMIKAGEIPDGFLMNALYLYKLYLKS